MCYVGVQTLCTFPIPPFSATIHSEYALMIWFDCSIIRTLTRVFPSLVSGVDSKGDVPCPGHSRPLRILSKPLWSFVHTFQLLTWSNFTIQVFKICAVTFCLLRKIRGTQFAPFACRLQLRPPPPSARDSIKPKVFNIVCWDNYVVFLHQKAHCASHFSKPVASP